MIIKVYELLDFQNESLFIWWVINALHDLQEFFEICLFGTIFDDFI